jgi:hypothetical protein
MPEPEITAEQTAEIEVPESVRFYDGLSIDLANYFNVYPVNLSTREKEQLKYIYENSPGKDINDKLRYISDMELKLGQPTDGSRFGKIWGWMKTMSVSRL